MQTFDMDPSAFDPRSRAAVEADSRLYVEFYMHYEKDEDASSKAGRPIFRDVEFIRITVPGDRNNIIERGASDIDKRRFADRYKRWKESGETTSDVGTKLEQWPLVTRAQVEEFRYFQIRTVEQLSQAPDAACQRIAGLADMRVKAQAWLAATNDTQAAEELSRKLKERDDKITLQATQIESQGKQLDELAKKMAEMDLPAPAQKRA